MRRYKFDDQKIIEMQLMNTKDAEEETEKKYAIIRNNLTRLFYASDMSIREFSSLADISPATIKRMISPKGKGEKINLSSLVKIATYFDYPLEYLFSNIGLEQTNMDDTTKQIENISKGIISSESRYKGFLTFASKGNIGLLPFHMQVNIYGQRKDATIVNSYKKWQMNGYRIKRGEHGIRVVKSGGRSLVLFDVSQTIHFSGPEINEDTIWDRDLAKELGYSDEKFVADYISTYADMLQKELCRVERFSEEQKEKILSFARNSLLYMVNERLDIPNDHISFGDMPDLDEYQAIRDIISDIVKDAFRDLYVSTQKNSRNGGT